MSLKLRLLLDAALLLLALALFFSYRAAHKSALALQSQLHSTQSALSDATARQQSRDAALAKTLSALQHKKSAVQTPPQILAALPDVLPLPKPLVADLSPQHNLTLPSEDLKPLYDFASDCQACQSTLATSQADLADERRKTSALTQERAVLLKAARGGSVWSRTARAARWFLIGAAAGALASRAAH